MTATPLLPGNGAPVGPTGPGGLAVPRRGAMNRRSRSGQALLELALVVPLLLLMVLGMVDFAGAWRTYQSITDVAREAARVCAAGVQGYNNQDIVDNVIDPGLDRAGLVPASATPTVTDCGNAFQGQPVTIRIEYPYQLGWVGTLLSLAGAEQTLTLTTEFTMQNEPLPAY